MKIELFLDEGEEYPQLFSVWRVDQNTGRADLTTRRNYVDNKKAWDQWRKTDDENIRLKDENAKLRKLAAQMGDMLDCVLCDRRLGCDWRDDGPCWYEIELRKLGVEVDDGAE